MRLSKLARGKKMTLITVETSIGNVVWRKGPEAGKMMDDFFCFDNNRCCPGVTVKLGHAAELRGKTDKLDSLLEKLNSLPDNGYKS